MLEAGHTHAHARMRNQSCSQHYGGYAQVMKNSFPEVVADIGGPVNLTCWQHLEICQLAATCLVASDERCQQLRPARARLKKCMAGDINHITNIRGRGMIELR